MTQVVFGFDHLDRENLFRGIIQSLIRCARFLFAVTTRGAAMPKLPWS